MRGVILAGGTGSRLSPITKVINKHLLPIYNNPMIYYPIKMLKNCGINDILIIVGGNSVGEFIDLLGDGEEFGVSITYKYQSSANGIAGALKLARNFVMNEPFIVCLGDNIFENYIPNIKEKFYANYNIDLPTSMIFLSTTDKPSNFGVPSFDGNKQIQKITEKPKNPDTNFAVTGLYIYDYNIWEMINTLKVSDRGEFEITDINNWYIKNGSLKYEIVDGWWRDGGSHESLLEASMLVAGINLESLQYAKK